MKRLILQRGVAGLALAALTATGLASIPTSAGAVVTSAEVSAGTSVVTSGPCNETGPADDTAHVPWSDNGIPVTATRAVTGTSQDPLNLPDVVDSSASAKATVTSTPISGNGAATISGTVDLAASAVSRGATTVCNVGVGANGTVTGQFSLTAPMWVNLQAASTGSATISFLVLIGPDGPIQVVVAGRHASGSASAIVPPGTYTFQYVAAVNVTANGADEGSKSLASSFKLDLQPLGNASAVSGKGTGFAQLGLRDCANGNIPVVITKKAKKRAKQVLVTVNGVKVAKLKGKKLKPTTLVLPAAPGSAATVEVTIRLRNGKKVTVTRSYLACS